jgi:hypothetical protein
MLVLVAGQTHTLIEGKPRIHKFFYFLVNQKELSLISKKIYRFFIRVDNTFT